jgi:hypothetical protein
MLMNGIPAHIRSDNGPEMVAKVLREWLTTPGTKSLCIEPGSPWENGYCESFNGKLRDELLNGEIYYSLKEAKVVIEQWRNYYNTKRPHSALGYRPPHPSQPRPNPSPSTRRQTCNSLSLRLVQSIRQARSETRGRIGHGQPFQGSEVERGDGQGVSERV